MLTLIRSRRFSRFSNRAATRYLTTLPREIPTFVKRWNPTAHRQIAAEKATVECVAAGRGGVEQVKRKVERQALRDAQQITVRSRWNGMGTRFAVRRLNHLLAAEAANGPRTAQGRSDFRAQLWRAYSIAKRMLPLLPARLPDRAWDILWMTQSVHTPMNRSRERHLEELYSDMQSIGRTGTVGQRITYLESLFFNGKEEQALEEWEKDHSSSGEELSRQDYKPEHLEAGVRLYALAGNPDRARDIMVELFDLYPTFDPSVMMNVFRAYTHVEGKHYHDSAKEIYEKMKAIKADNCTLEDYDAWLVGFLEARHLSYAKLVFRDMIKDGYLATNFSEEQVNEVLKRLHLLYRLGSDISKMTNIALHAISALPEPYHPCLFGDWMKSAVVNQAPEAAAQILDIMFERGYKPETYHFNLLLRVLFRTKDESRILKAENIGWRMIEEARKSSYKKPGEESIAGILSKRASTTTVEPILDSVAARKVPPANTVTFSMLIQHHARNQQWEHASYVERLLKQAVIPPDTAIMNALMDNQCRQSKYSEAWKIYRTLTDAREDRGGVFPDGASFRCLWKTLRLALGDHATRNDDRLPTPRQLLAETLHWWNLCRSRHDAERFRMGIAAADHGAITALMMHCFSYTQDLPGSLVALYALKEYFDIFPSDKAVEILQKQVAWVDMHKETRTVRSQYYHSKNHKRKIEKMGRIYHILMQERLKKMKITGKQYAYIGKRKTQELDLNVLSEFVRVILKRRYLPETVEAMIDEAKKEIGVPDLPTGDIDAFAVS